MGEDICRDLSENGWYSKYINLLIWLNLKKKKSNPIKKLAEERNRHFLKDITDGKDAHARCLTTLTIRKMWIKMTIRYTTSHLSEWLLSKRQEMTCVGENMEKR